MEKISIAVGVVTYNPDIQLLFRCISSIINQVSYTIIVDNGSKNIDDISLMLQHFNNVVLVKNEKNEGIAYALNKIGQKSEEFNCSWFLTLDQDSVCDSNMIAQYLNYIDVENVAIIVPRIKLRVHSNNSINAKSGFEYVNLAITSGSLIKTSAWKQVQGFWDFLFIDKVDDDFCYAVREANMKIISVNEVVLEHEIGTPRIHSFFGVKFFTDSYPHFRYYYIARNTIIVSFSHKNLVNNNVVFSLFKRFIKIVVGEDNKCQKLKSFIKGVKDGINWCIKVRKRNS